MPKAIRITAVLLLAIAVLLAVVAIGLGRRSSHATPVASPGAASAPRYDVVVAARALTAGMPLSANDLTVATLAERPAGTFVYVGEATGGILLQDVAAGQPVPRSGVSRGIALALNPGERAVAVPVDELASAGNRVSPGDHVDVFMSLPGVAEPAGTRQGGMQARLLLSRLRVLGYGDRDMLSTAPAAATQAPEETKAPEPGSRAASIIGQGGTGGASATSQAATPARTAVLAVPVEMIGRLLLGAQSGKLFLALRNPIDTAVADNTLFAAPAPVLPLRSGLDGMATEEAQRPENQAFAGVDLGGLAGTRSAMPAPAAAPPQRTLRRTRTGGGIEVVRGSNPATPLSSP
jgi:pilus assembly protein CpaB